MNSLFDLFFAVTNHEVSCMSSQCNQCTMVISEATVCVVLLLYWIVLYSTVSVSFFFFVLVFLHNTSSMKNV